MANLFRGVMLLQREDRGGSDYFTIWTVLSTRTLKNGDLKVKLVSGASTFSIDADATFKGGVLGEDWQVFSLNQTDKAIVFKKRSEAAKENNDAEV